VVACSQRRKSRGRTLTDRRPKRSNDPGEPGWKWVTRELLALIRQFGNTAVWAGVCVYAIYQIGVTLRAFAGKQSVANLLLNVAAHVSLTAAVSVTVSIGTTGMYLYEYRRHRKTRERLTVRITDLERRLDRNRSSSGISTQGTTQIGDL